MSRCYEGANCRNGIVVLLKTLSLLHQLRAPSLRLEAACSIIPHHDPVESAVLSSGLCCSEDALLEPAPTSTSVKRRKPCVFVGTENTLSLAPETWSAVVSDGADCTLGVGTTDPYVVITEATSSRAADTASADACVAKEEARVRRVTVSNTSVRPFRWRLDAVSGSISGDAGEDSPTSEPTTFPEGSRGRPWLSKIAAQFGKTIKQ
jgi:hypothetical protein